MIILIHIECIFKKRASDRGRREKFCVDYVHCGVVRISLKEASPNKTEENNLYAFIAAMFPLNYNVFLVLNR